MPIETIKRRIATEARESGTNQVAVALTTGLVVVLCLGLGIGAYMSS